MDMDDRQSCLDVDARQIVISFASLGVGGGYSGSLGITYDAPPLSPSSPKQSNLLQSTTFHSVFFH